MSRKTLSLRPVSRCEGKGVAKQATLANKNNKQYYRTQERGSRAHFNTKKQLEIDAAFLASAIIKRIKG
jgi:hypothetical protein